MDLTEHFSLEEMLRSEAAVRLCIDEQFSPPDSVKENLKSLCENVLEPLRAKLKEKVGNDVVILVSSGYRCEKVNASIGGASNSQHLLGQASDSTAKGLTVEQYYQFVKESGIEIDQCIQEFGHWVHISFNPFSSNRNQFLRAIKVDKVTKYIPDNNIIA